MKELNSSQKTLVIVAFVLFLFANIISFIVVLPSLRIDAIKNLFISKPVAFAAKLNGQSSAKSYNFGEEIINQSGESEVTFNGNKLFSASSSDLVVESADKINIKKGLYYIEVNNDFIINLSKGNFLLNKGIKAIFNSSDSTVIIIAGSQKVSKTETAEKNQIISYEVDNFKIKPFDRSNLTGDYDLKQLITALEDLNNLPDELKYINPPEITEIQPQTGYSTFDTTVDLSAKTDSKAEVTVNDEKVTLDSNGSFKKTINLDVGKNTIRIVAKDIYGNTQASIVNYTRQSKSTCNFTAFDVQLNCLINEYRQSQGINNLSLNVDLGDIAYKHAYWMDTNTSLEHVESDGTNFKDRCLAQKLSCKQEINLSVDSNPTAEAFFDLLKQNDNADLLIDYTQVGIGQYKNYISILLN